MKGTTISYRFTSTLIKVTEWQLECEVLIKVRNSSGIFDVKNRERDVFLNGFSETKSRKRVIFWQSAQKAPCNFEHLIHKS